MLPEFQRLSSKTLPGILKAGNKYKSAINEEAAGSSVAKKIISDATRDNLLNVDQMFTLAAEKMAKSYHDNVYDFMETQHNITNITFLLEFTLYSIKTDFIRECESALNTIDDTLEGVQNHLRRTHNIFNEEPANVQNVPRDYVPVTFPFLMPRFHNDFLSMKNNSEENEFPQHITSVSFESQSQMVDHVNSQIKAASAALEATIKASTKLDEAVKTGLLAKLDDIVSNGDKNIDSTKDGAEADLKKKLPTSYEENGSSHFVLGFDTQENGDDFARNLNFDGNEVISDIINMFEMLYDL